MQPLCRPWQDPLEQVRQQSERALRLVTAESAETSKLRAANQQLSKDQKSAQAAIDLLAERLQGTDSQIQVLDQVCAYSCLHWCRRSALCCKELGLAVCCRDKNSAVVDGSSFTNRNLQRCVDSYLIGGTCHIA